MSKFRRKFHPGVRSKQHHEFGYQLRPTLQFPAKQQGNSMSVDRIWPIICCNSERLCVSSLCVNYSIQKYTYHNNIIQNICRKNGVERAGGTTHIVMTFDRVVKQGSKQRHQIGRRPSILKPQYGILGSIQLLIANRHFQGSVPNLTKLKYTIMIFLL